ncbi:MAG TPA: hypothetical protein VFH00_13030 [Candidatus Nitrosotalea sp.]|nr:hypothetical protein [Candidatus Nitrosotalea sp.]
MKNRSGIKYVLVYYGGGMPQGASAQARVLKQWATWYEKLGDAIVDGGHAFSGAVSKIKPGGTVAKGAIGQRASGYSIVEAASLEEATKMAKGCPILRSGGQIAVYETFEAM